MRVISGLNYTKKLKKIIQECVQQAKEHPFENFIFIAENPQVVEKIFFQYRTYLVNIKIVSWQRFLQELQVEYHLTAHHVINNVELTYHLQHILKNYSFRCFKTNQPYPLINKFIPLLKELNLSMTQYKNIDLSTQPKLVDFVNIQQYLSEQLDDYTHLTIEDIFHDCTFDLKKCHIYIEADHLYQPLRQNIIQRLAQYHDVTLLYTYHQDNRLFNMPYHTLCQNADELKEDNFLIDNLFLQAPATCDDEKELYTFKSPTPQQEVKRVVYTIYQKIVDENLRYQDFVIVYPNQTYADILINVLKQRCIPHHLSIVSSCQYDSSYQYILKAIDELSDMQVCQFARELNNEHVDYEYQQYLESLYHYNDIMTPDEFKEFFIATYKKNHQEKNNSQDHISIYSINDFKNDKPKHIFILGMNETVLPQFIKDTSLLLNEDIEFLRKHHISTPLTTREQLGVHYNDILKALQQPYLSMTFSYSVSTLDNETLLPSSLYKQLKTMYHLKDLPFNQYLSIEDYYAIGGQVDDKDIINHHIHDYLENKNQPVSLSQETTQNLYSSSMSVSQIETYNKCPFSYFIQYGLGVYPLSQDKLMPNELGNIVHYVLSRSIKKNTNINQLVDYYISKDENLSKKIQSSQVNQYFIEQMKKDLVVTIDVLHQILDISLFEIQSQEQKIEDDIKGIRFKGFVDRIDTYQKYVSIIDYKSSTKDIDLNLAIQGFNIQMLLYLKMITKKYQKDPAAVLYFNTKRRVLSLNQSLKDEIHDDDIQDLYRYGGYVVDDDNHEIIQAIDPKMERKSHVVNVSYVKSRNEYKGHILTTNQLENLLEEIENHIYELYQQIISGNIQISPKGSDQSATHTTVNPCRYCSYHSICQFDVFYNDYELVEFYDLEEKLGGKDDAI